MPARVLDPAEASDVKTMRVLMGVMLPTGLDRRFSPPFRLA
jgi:hypothetical protein